MQHFVFSLFIALTSISVFALPKQLRCKAENVLDPINKFGNVTFSFDPLNALWVGVKGDSKTLFSENVICGRNISNVQVQPTCVFEDKSDNYLRYTLACDTQYEDGTTQWFSKGGVAVSDVTKNGRFECRTKYGTAGSIILNLSDCN